MRIGTRSILFGAHQLAIHPWFVAWAWWQLFGFPWDVRLWVAFFVHDLGYLGKPNMDGPEGETHVELGARIMHRLFDRRGTYRWRDFCLYHSRFYAKRDNRPFSRLCVADKLSLVLTPAWLYIPLARLSGEIREYMKLAQSAGAKYSSMNVASPDRRQWLDNVKEYLWEWVLEHKDGRDDTWTPVPSGPQDS
jgi:hypothetical protein